MDVPDRGLADVADVIALDLGPLLGALPMPVGHVAPAIALQNDGAIGLEILLGQGVEAYQALRGVGQLQLLGAGAGELLEASGVPLQVEALQLPSPEPIQHASNPPIFLVLARTLIPRFRLQEVLLFVVATQGLLLLRTVGGPIRVEIGARGVVGGRIRSDLKLLLLGLSIPHRGLCLNLTLYIICLHPLVLPSQGTAKPLPRPGRTNTRPISPKSLVLNLRLTHLLN